MDSVNNAFNTMQKKEKNHDANEVSRSNSCFCAAQKLNLCSILKKSISAYAPANIVLLTRGFCRKAGFCKIIRGMYYCTKLVFHGGKENG
jgi:hypothetical protein